MPEEQEIVYITAAQLAEIDQQELEGWDPAADALADLPPVPAGTYLCKAKFSERDPDKRWPLQHQDDGKPYSRTNVLFEIVENPLNPQDLTGRLVSGWVGTTIRRFTKQSQVAALLQASGYGELILNKPRVVRTQVDALNEAMVNEPLVGIIVDWEASKWDREKRKFLFGPIRGMARSFPKNPDGTYQPFLYDPKEGEIPARNIIRRFIRPDDIEEVEVVGEDPPTVAEILADPRSKEPVTQQTQTAQPAPAPATAMPAPAPSSVASGAPTGRVAPQGRRAPVTRPPAA